MSDHGSDGAMMRRDNFLEGVRVLELTRHLAGPFAGMTLGDLGADVVKLESLSGDPQRKLSPHREGVGVMYASLNRNKRSVALDLWNPEATRILTPLVLWADVVLNNYRPGVMDDLGLSFDHVRRLNNRIVYVSVTGYGLTGPRRDQPAYDLAIQALTGVMSITGYPDTPPARAGIPIADICAGMNAALATSAALARPASRQEAVHIDCSLFDTQVAMLNYWAAIYLNTGEVVGPQGGGNSKVVPYGPVKASDDWFVIAPCSGHFWEKLCDAIARPDLAVDRRFRSNDARVSNARALQELLDIEFQRHTVKEWIHTLNQHGVPCAPINDVEQAMMDPQVAARNMRVPLDIEGVRWELPGNPIKVHPPEPPQMRPPPALGEHTGEVLQDLAGLSASELARLRRAGVIA